MADYADTTRGKGKIQQNFEEAGDPASYKGAVSGIGQAIQDIRNASRSLATIMTSLDGILAAIRDGQKGADEKTAALLDVAERWPHVIDATIKEAARDAASEVFHMSKRAARDVQDAGAETVASLKLLQAEVEEIRNAGGIAPGIGWLLLLSVAQCAALGWLLHKILL